MRSCLKTPSLRTAPRRITTVLRAGESSRRVPFPADEIGKKKGPAHLVTESDAASDGSAAEPKDSDGRSDGLVSTASGVLDSGRQAVKQAMAATTNWFSPSAKSGASDSDEAATAPRHAAPAVPGGSIMAPPPLEFRLRRPGSFGLRARRAPAHLHRDVYRHIRWHRIGWHCIGWHCVVVSGYRRRRLPRPRRRPAHAVHVLSADGSRGCVVAMAGGASAFGAVVRAGLVQCRGDRHPPEWARHCAIHARCTPVRPGSGDRCKLVWWLGLLRRGRGVRGRRRCGRASELSDVCLPGTQRRR